MCFLWNTPATSGISTGRHAAPRLLSRPTTLLRRGQWIANPSGRWLRGVWWLQQQPAQLRPARCCDRKLWSWKLWSLRQSICQPLRKSKRRPGSHPRWLPAVLPQYWLQLPTGIHRWFHQRILLRIVTNSTVSAEKKVCVTALKRNQRVPTASIPKIPAAF